MTLHLAKRLFWNVIPAGLIIFVVSMTLLGQDGLLKRHLVKQQLLATQAEAAELAEGNATLRAEIRRLKKNPVTVKRAAAERLLAAEPNSTIYRFDLPK